MGIFDTLKKKLRKSWRKEPLTEIDWITKGLALYGLGKFHEAIECFEKFIELAPPQYRR